MTEGKVGGKQGFTPYKTETVRFSDKDVVTTSGFSGEKDDLSGLLGGRDFNEGE